MEISTSIHIVFYQLSTSRRKMKKVVSLLFLLSSTLVNGGFLTGHHPYPAVLSSRTIISGAVGGGPTNGAYSSSQSSQTVSAPAQVQSSISTYHPVPVPYGYSGRQSQIGQGQNQGGQNSQGQSSQGQGGYSYGYNSDNPSILAYRTYGFGQGQNGQGQSGQGGGYGGQGQGNQGQRGYGNNGGGQGNGLSTHGYGYY